MASIGMGEPTRAPGKESERGFYTGMAALIALVVGAGFGPSYGSSLSPPGLPLWVHLHGAVMVSWIVLFGVQAWLVGRRALSLHRKIGWVSVGLVVTMTPLGIATTMLAVKRGATPPFFTPAQMIAADVVDLAFFLGLYVAAVLLRKKGDWHKRLLLSATVLLSWPGVARLSPLGGLGLHNIIPAASILMVVLACIGPMNDLIRRRRVHPAYFWGVAMAAAIQPLYPLLAASPPMQALAMSLTEG